MTVLVLRPSFVEGQLHAMKIMNDPQRLHAYKDKFTQNEALEALVTDVVDLSERVISSVLNHDEVEKIICTLDSFVMSFGNTAEFDEWVAAALIWTMLSQILYVNELMFADFAEPLRSILGMLI